MLCFGFGAFPILASSHGLFGFPVAHLSSQIVPDEPCPYRVPVSESKPGTNQILLSLQEPVFSLTQQGLGVTGRIIYVDYRDLCITTLTTLGRTYYSSKKGP